MKKRLVMALLAGVMTLTSAIPVCAAPKQMADGNMFDAEYYAISNPDVVAVLGTNENLLYNHYVNNGKNEGRKPYGDGAVAPKFDAVYYAKNNPDVVAALGTDEAVLYNHYITSGKNEGRIPCENGTPFMEVAPLETQVPATATGEVSAESQQPNVVKDSRLGAYVDHKRGITYSLPYIVNGVDIRNGDVNGDGINDNNHNTWYEGQVWTASNGYTLRIVDKYYVNPGPLNGLDAVFVDGTESADPAGPFMIAQDEYQGRTSYTSISADGIPQINTVTSKQTSINVNDPSLSAYKAAYDPLWKKQNKGGFFTELYFSEKGISLILMGYSSIASVWRIFYDSSSGDWCFHYNNTVAGFNFTTLAWNSVKNCLRMVTPDADAIYNVIYQSIYYGGTGIECDRGQESNWITVGNTQLKTDRTSGYYFRFK